MRSASAQSYRQVELLGKLSAASPHRLVEICYEELLLSLAAIRAAGRLSQHMANCPEFGRARAILLQLESALDFEMGGDFAFRLAAIYRALQRELTEAARQGDTGIIDRVIEGVASLSDAWSRISP